MSRFKMLDGTVIDTDNATQSWEESTEWDGNNHRSVHTGDKFAHEQLYRSRRGRYYKVCSSQWQGSVDHAEWLSPEQTAQWILLNGDELPEELVELEEEVSE